MKIKKFANHWALLLVFLLSWWAVKPLFHSGFFPMHDDTQVARVYQMAQALKDGQFPVRWVKDLGYGFGYPIFNFYAPLAYYVGALFNLVSFNALVATKIMFGVGVILAGVTMYFLAKEFWGEAGGVIAALFYVYAPYHAVDIYVRGAAAEFWAMAFLPLVFLGIYQIFKGHHQGIITAAAALAAVILSHNLTALMEMNLTKVFGQIGGGADWRDHFVFLDQLWASPWGFAGSAPGRLDGMSLMVGKLHILMVLLGLITLYRVWCQKDRRLTLGLSFALIFFGLAVFLTTNASRFIWEMVPILAFFQYPWRFLIFTALASAFIAGSVVLWLKRSKGWLKAGLVVPILTVLLFFNVKYFQPQGYFNISTADYIKEGNIKWKTSKISDEYLPKDFPVPRTKEEVVWEKVEVSAGEAEIRDTDFRSHLYCFTVHAKTDSQILVNTAYFPGWRVWIDDKETQPEIFAGKIQLAFSPGTHRVVLKFTNTPIRILANLISFFIGITAIIYIFVVKQRRKQ